MRTTLHRFGLAAGLLVGSAGAGCGASALLQPDAPQGIEGLVTIGPMCPVQTLDDPCPDAPYDAWIDVRTSSGAQVTRVRSGEDGEFRLGLRPGTYLLEPETGGRFPTAAEQLVEVESGTYTDVLISYDSGIR